tara:strand:+ start:184 stop:954 length:771 start_codon:yes stop_codon:yes gene_type:complete
MVQKYQFVPTFASMKIASALLSTIWKCYFFIVILVSILLLYPILFFLLQNEKYFLKGFHLVRYQAKAILLFAGIRYWLEEPDSLPTAPYIICPNHTSYLDILLIYATCNQFFVFLGKKELGSIPLFNIYFKQFNLLVDRNNPKASSLALEECAKRLRAGCNVVIFPEGTISLRAPQLRPFKNGAFKLAIQEQVPILPVTFTNNYKIVSAKPSRFMDYSRPGKAGVIIHDAISTSHMKLEDCVLLANQTRERIESKL